MMTIAWEITMSGEQWLMRFYLKIDTLPLIFLHYKKTSHDSNFPIYQLEFLRCIILRIIPFDFYVTTPLSDFLGFIYRTILLLCFVSSLFSSTLGFRRSSSNGFQTREFHQFLKQGSGAVRITSYWTSKNGKEWSSAFFPRWLHAYSNHSSLDCSSIYKRIQKWRTIPMLHQFFQI